MRKKSVYSWVLPAKNEADSLPQLLLEINKAMRKHSLEIILVNDGSGDQTRTVLKQKKYRFSQLKIINFPLPQGKWAALRAGLALAQGEFIITADADLQDDPGEISKLTPYLSRGYDFVSGWRQKRRDAFYKVLISRLGNRLVSLATGQTFHDLNSPYKIYRQEILANLPQEGALLRFSLLFAHKMGYKTIEVPVHHRPRLHGQSKFGLFKYLRIIYDLILVLLLFTGSSRIIRKI